MEKKYLNFSNKKSLQLEREEHLAEFAVSLTEKQKLSLYKKSQKSGIDTGILEEVYRRGYLIWKSDLFEGTREQFAFDRVNSFISGGFAADIDKDLLEAETLEESDSALRKKAAKSGVSFGTLKKVYNRGMAAWKTGHRPGTTPQQWGMARVNSYITKGKTYHTADKDLREEYPAVRKDKETGLPKKYTTGKTGTDKARAAHFARGRKMADDDPRAYKPAPGDSTAKTKESKYTKKAREIYGENINYELPTTNPDLSSSRFDGTDELVNIYKSMTPGQEPKTKKLIVVIKKTVKEHLNEATYKGKTVKLNKPFRTPGGPKKSAVYVDPDGDGKAQIVRFGDPNMKIKKNIPARRKSFRARHHCDTNPGPKTKARYWSCRAW